MVTQFVKVVPPGAHIHIKINIYHYLPKLSKYNYLMIFVSSFYIIELQLGAIREQPGALNCNRGAGSTVSVRKKAAESKPIANLDLIEGLFLQIGNYNIDFQAYIQSTVD